MPAPIRPPVRYRAILTDFDGVLRHWPATDRALEAECGLPSGAIRETAFSPSVLEPAIRGDIGDAEWRESIACLLQQRYPTSRASRAVSLWSANAGRIDRETLSLLRRCAPNGRLVLLTNATSRLHDDLREHGLSEVFASVVSSSDVGAVKPAADIFSSALDACGCHAGEVVCIDDDERNVAAARELGIRTHRYTSNRALREFLERVRLL